MPAGKQNLRRIDLLTVDLGFPISNWVTAFCTAQIFGFVWDCLQKSLYDIRLTCSQTWYLNTISQVDLSLSFIHNSQNILSHQGYATDYTVWSAEPLKNTNQRVKGKNAPTLIKTHFQLEPLFSVDTSPRRLGSHNYTDWHIQFHLHERGHFLYESLTLLGEVGLRGAIINPNTLGGSEQISQLHLDIWVKERSVWRHH